jgi:FHA domain-containing protein
MAILQNARGKRPIPCRCLIGRSTLADLRLSSRRASSEHASLGWYSERWVLRDLGSSNGTSVDGRTLSSRDRVTLSCGNELRFGGDDEVWTVINVDTPDPCAVLLGPQEYKWGQESLLVLPSIDAPEASVFVDREGWRLDSGSELSSPECGDVIRLQSGHYRLLLPDHSGRSRALTAKYELDLALLELSFNVSPERVALTLRQGSTEVQLPARACIYTLLALARLRGGERPTPDSGWISSGELAEVRGCSTEKVNVDIHRLRRLFQEAGVHNAAQIVERDDAKRLRIGAVRTSEARG